MNLVAGDADDFWNVLGSRRMCRDFETRAVPEHDLQRVANAAFRGPSAGNTAGLDLVILTDTAVSSYWDVTLPPAARSSFRWPGLLDAPVLIIPAVNPAAYLKRYSEHDKTAADLGASEASWPIPYWFVDGGAAVMAMLLAAESLGLGALFFGQFDHETAVSARFGIPGGHRSLGTVALGFPAADGRRPSASARSGRPVSTRFIHRNCW